jgi:hypothetical protein
MMRYLELFAGAGAGGLSLGLGDRERGQPASSPQVGHKPLNTQPVAVCADCATLQPEERAA